MNDDPGAAPRRQIMERIAELESSLSVLRRELLNVQTDAQGTFDALGFLVHGKAYAVFLSDVVEVLRMVKWVPLPKAPRDIEGVVNCRGTVIPVINPGGIFSDRALTPSVNNALVVIAASGQNIAIMVEQVLGVQTHQNKDLTLVGESQAVHRTLPSYVIGFIKANDSHVSIIDVNQLLAGQDQRALSTALRERDEWGRV